MRIISRSTLREFWENSLYKDSEQPLRAWYDEAKQASWKTQHDIKEKYRHASFPGNNRVVFNIKGNSYRLIVSVNYERGMLYIRFIGTHKQYDEVDATTI